MVVHDSKNKHNVEKTVAADDEIEMFSVKFLGSHYTCFTVYENEKDPKPFAYFVGYDARYAVHLYEVSLFFCIRTAQWYLS